MAEATEVAEVKKRKLRRRKVMEQLIEKRDAALENPPAPVQPMTRRTMQLSPGRRKGAEYERTLHVITADGGTTREDLLRTEYWAHIAQDLKAYDRLEVRADDGTFYAEYLVLDVSRVWAKVKELNWWPLSTLDVSLSQAQARYRADWGGPYYKWRVIRNVDNEMIAHGMAKDDAIIRAAELEKLA